MRSIHLLLLFNRHYFSNIIRIALGCLLLSFVALSSQGQEKGIKGKIQTLGQVNLRALQQKEKQLSVDSFRNKKFEEGPEENTRIQPLQVLPGAIIKRTEISPGFLKLNQVNKDKQPGSKSSPQIPGGIGGGVFGGLRPPDMGGAVSSGYLVETINTQVIVTDRSGTVLTAVSLAGFFSSIGTVPDVFDPHVLFDNFQQRWIITAAANRNSATSGVVVGISATADPTGTWNNFFMDADATDLAWLDFPMMGLNRNWIVISGNLYSRSGGITGATNAANCQVTSPGHGLVTGNVVTFSNVTGMTQLNGNSYTITVVDANNFLLNVNSTGYGVFVDNPNDKWFMPITNNAICFVLDKASIYGGAAAAPTIFNPAAQGSYPAWVGDNTTNSLMLVANWNGNSGGNGYLGVYTIGGTPAAPTLSAVQFVSTSNTWASSGPAAPQQGSAVLLATNDSRMEQVVLRNGSLWCAHTVFLPAASATHAAVQWWQINATTLAVQQLGRIEDATAAIFYTFPSIDVNAYSDVVVGFSRASASQFGSANYAYHLHGDAAGTMNPDVVFKAGLAKYDGGRWGDYSSTSVDPDLNSFWVLQEYSQTPSGGLDRWGTEWQQVILPVANLYVKDRPEDLGAEPNPSVLPMWQSEDIWLRKTQDASHTFAHVHEDGEFRTDATHPNYVYVEVHNRGGASSVGTEQLSLYWAKAGSSLSWNSSWNGSTYFDPPANTMLMGAPIGTQTIPAVTSGSSVILEFPWMPPNPASYTGVLAADQNHFCLLARITTSTSAPYGMTFPETTNLYSNVQNNNHIVWKNISVFDLNPSDAPVYTVVGNFGDQPMMSRFRFEMKNDQGVAGLLNRGVIRVTVDGNLKEILKNYRAEGQGIKQTGDGVFEISREGTVLDHILLPPHQYGTLKMQFIANDKNDLGKGFAITFTHSDVTTGTEQIVGGQTYVFGKVSGFQTNASEGKKGFEWHWWYWLVIGLIVLVLVLLLRRR
ncbi:MAG: ubiquitin-activating E1 FCCH domain-containing protein [Flavisolibacter sp.]